MRTAQAVFRLASLLPALAQDALRSLLLATRSSAALKAENMFLRKQLALHLEREVKSRRASNATRLCLVLLSRLFVWQDALVNVKPETFLGWHRRGFRLLSRWKSRPCGRPQLREEVQKLIRRMARENPTGAEKQIAAELLVKLGIQLSARTVRRYMPLDSGPRKCVPSQRWMTLVRNHAQAILACDFFVVVTASFRALYVFAPLEVGTRRIAPFPVTAHPTAAWTLQQFCEVIIGDQPQRFLIHARDSIFSSELDAALKAMDLRISWCNIFRKCFHPSWPCPPASRMFRHLEVNDAPTVMSHHHQDKKDPKRGRGNGQEIDRDEILDVVVQQGLASLGRWFPGLGHPSGNRVLGNLPSQLEPFPLNARRTPIGVRGRPP
jgi:hypothetical protein